MAKCNICEKRMWFWQHATYRKVIGSWVPPEYLKIAHWKCFIKKHAQDVRLDKQDK